WTGGDVDDVLLERVIDGGEQQPLALRFGSVVERVFPDVVEAAGRMRHQEPAVLAPRDAGPDDLGRGGRRVERQVGFLLVLTPPGDGPGKAVGGAVLAEDEHDGADAADDAAVL